MKWLLVALATVALAVLVVLVTGWLLPVSHVSTRQQLLAAPPDQVWQALTDRAAFPSWRDDVQRVERLPDRNGQAAWVEEGKNGRIALAVERSDPPRVLVTRITDPDLPFGGTWTYDLQSAESGSTLLTITERGEVYNPIFRFASRFVFGHEATIASYMDDLRERMDRRTLR